MCGLCSAFLFSHQETVSSVRDSAQGKAEKVAGPVRFLFPGPTSSLLPLDWSQLDADQRCARTQPNALPSARLPPAHSHTPPDPSALSIPVSQNNNPLHPFHFDNVTSTQPHQINKLAAGLVSSHSPAIVSPSPLWSPLHDTTCSCGNCHGGTALHCAAHRLSVFLAALQRQHSVINLFYTRWTFQPTTQARS